MHLDLLTLIADGGEQRLQLVVVDVLRIEAVHTIQEVAKNVHVVREGVEGRRIDSAVETYVRRLRGHEAEVVACLQIIPVEVDLRVVGNAHAVGHTIEFVEGLALHGVTQPAAHVALLVDPRECVGHIESTNALGLHADLGRSGERDALLLCASGNGAQEVENVRRQRLSDAQCREFHEDVDDLALLGVRGNLVHVVVSEERIALPLRIVEAQGDVVRELHIAEQQLQVGSQCAVVDIVRRLPSQHVLGTLCEHALEAHLSSLQTDVVRVDERRVAEHLRCLAEVFLHLCHLLLHVGGEALSIDERRQTVAIGLSEELHTTRLVHFLQLLQHLRSVHLELLDAYARKRECHLEVLAVLLDHLMERVERGHIGALGNVADATLVLVVIVVVMVGTDIEETIALQMNDLMYFKI